MTRKRVVNFVRIDLGAHDIPFPHYLLDHEDRQTEVSEDNRFLLTRALFPSSDVTVSSRGHANLTHLMHATWNGGHFLRIMENAGELVILSAYAVPFKMIFPDQEVVMEIERLHISKNKKYGTIRAQFFEITETGDNSGILLAEVTSNFGPMPGL